MARRVFYSFHHEPDNSRAAQVRNMGVVEGNKPASDNDWETITKKGDAAIEKWIGGQLDGKSCTVRANRRRHGWSQVDQVRNQRILEQQQGTARRKYPSPQEPLMANSHQKEATPLMNLPWARRKKTLSSVVKVYNPPHSDSKDAYAYIKDNLEDWIEEAISIRDDFQA